MSSKRALPLPDVIRYDDYRRYLKDWQEARRQRDEPWSCEFIGRRLPYRAPDGALKGVHRSHVQNILSGERDLAPELVDGMIRVLGLTSDRARYFGHLVTFNQARTDSEKQRAWLDMLANRRFLELRPLDARAYEALSDLRTLALFELVGAPGFKEDADELARRMMPAWTAAEVREALRTLEELGCLRREKGRLVQQIEGFAAASEAQPMALARLHRQALELAHGALDHLAPGERELQLLVERVPEGKVAAVKAEIQDFLSRVQAVCGVERGEAPERVWVIAVQGFPVSVEGNSSSPAKS